MRHPRLSALAIAATVLALGSTAAAPASAAGAHYVALGDSYSSGDGAGSYDSSSGSCLRSANAYPAKWAAAHAPASYKFVACAGATTTDLINSQVSAVTSDTTLVSMTTGGNDVGFSNVMETCVLSSDSACKTAVANAESAAASLLPGRFATLFGKIRAAAPAAHVVVLDYPHLYYITSFCIGLSNAKRTALNAGADYLDTVIAKATADAGYTFADVRSRFSGHELCSGDGWLHSVTYPIDESYHPTATGQASGYLPVFTAAT
jgi:hypothetical protein